MAGLFHATRSLLGWSKRPNAALERGLADDPAVVEGLRRVLDLPDIGAMRRLVGEFERDFARHVGAGHAIGASSGTTALYLALSALGIGPGDEVLTVANSWITTVTAIRETGAEPRFVDVSSDSGVMDPAALEAAIGPRAKAILPVHMYGIPADMRRIMRIAQAHGLPVIEDACQGAGAAFEGRPVGGWGDIGCFSFHINKLVGSPSDGGMLVTNSDQLARRLRSLSEADWRNAASVRQPRIPSRLAALSVPLLRARLASLEERVAARRRQFERYRARLGSVSGVKLLIPPPDGQASCRTVVAVSAKTPAIQARLAKAGWAAGPMYADSLGFLNSVDPDKTLPETHSLLERHLVVPSGPDLSDGDIDRLADLIGAAAGKGA